ncbi:MAG TPA: energy-coupling factor transporter transmembrane component T [Acidimicrobiales bacterium]|nr:energy-coupling factor transporter transmembrane component T [Acidimicrobiales bacterium]
MPRNLHPIAWWLWALGLATAASRTTNPILLMLVLGVLGFVVANRRGEAPWARAFKYYLFLALVVIAIRVVSRSLFGGDTGAGDVHVLFTLPHAPLPSWAAGVQLGGPVTLEGTLSALYAGLQLGCLLCCMGAANTLANPKRALRVLPGALHELGVAVVVTLSVAPQLVESVQRVRRARKLRGGATRGFRALRGIAIPVLEDALERSLRLAAAMDSRGYGRTGSASPRARRATGAFMVVGMCGLCVGAYGLFGGSGLGPLSVPALLGGSALCCLGLAIGSRRVRRSHYRPDPWQAPEWAVVACGAVPAVLFLVSAGFGATGLNPSVYPLTWPSLPIIPVLGVLVAALAGLAAPPPLRPARAVVREGKDDRATPPGGDGSSGAGRPGHRVGASA